jgi:hypothetical protein
MDRGDVVDGDVVDGDVVDGDVVDGDVVDGESVIGRDGGSVGVTSIRRPLRRSWTAPLSATRPVVTAEPSGPRSRRMRVRLWRTFAVTASSTSSQLWHADSISSIGSRTARSSGAMSGDSAAVTAPQPVWPRTITRSTPRCSTA